MKTIVLDTEQISRIVKRIAYQVIEACSTDSEVIIIGIEPRGSWVAERINESLLEIGGLNSNLIVINPNETFSNEIFRDQIVLIVDDIVNSGSTMMRVAGHVSLANPSRLMTACLVDRMHRRFPIQSDFTGLSLATTLKEHLSLQTGPKPLIHLE
jgi:pyrimidine operon attenuation protein / uracil phosphoribosyltransferase